LFAFRVGMRMRYSAQPMQVHSAACLPITSARTRSSLSQPISNPSEHQRVLEQSIATRPSCRPVFAFAVMTFEQQSNRPCAFITR
jgi:hypothetical protein